MENDEGFTEFGFEEETVVKSLADTTNCEGKWNLQQKGKDLLNLFTDSSRFRWITIFIMVVVVILSCYTFLRLIGYGILFLERATHSEEQLLVKRTSYEEQAELSVNEIFQQIEGQSLNLKCKIRNLNRMREQHHVKESENENILKETGSLTEKLEIRSWDLNCVIESILDDTKFSDVPSKNAVR
ncbi:hypothetical protein X975_17206, partial [Stegodyphus mimosarum]